MPAPVPTEEEQQHAQGGGGHANGSQPNGAAQQMPTHVHSDGSHEEHLLPRLSIIPHRHTKVIHLIRHAQGFHNVAGQKDHAEYKSWAYEDAHLTEFGWSQAKALGAHIRGLGSAFRADAIIVSPLTRTLETAAGVFGRGRWQEVDPQPPLMLAQTEVPGKRALQPAISAAGCPPFIAWEGCREHLGEHPCDKRRPIREIHPCFPAVDFSLVESDEDVLWKLEHRETHDEIKRRGVRFMQFLMSRPERHVPCRAGPRGLPPLVPLQLWSAAGAPSHAGAAPLWLMSRPESHLAVVSHSSFIFFMLQAFGHSAGPTVQGELHKWYDNCELRTVVLADEGGAHAHPDPLHFRPPHMQLA